MFLLSNKLFKKIVLAILIFCFVLSSLIGIYLFDIYGGFKSIGLRYPQLKFVEKVPKILNAFYIFYYLVPDKIPEYQLIISQENLKIINDSLPSAEWIGDFYKIPGRLEEENRKKVKAIFIAGEKEYEVKIGYRGDFPEHWENEKKSWRINFQDELFNGKSSINLIVAEGRNYILEEFNNYRAKRMDLFVPDSQLINLKINGQLSGVHWEVEHWNKEMLERNGLHSNTNLYGENDLFLTSDTHSIYDSIDYWKKYSENSYDKIDDYSDLDRLLNLLNNSSDDYFNKHINSILDLDNFYHWQAHSVLSGSLHQDWNHNARLYFDIEIGKFKFIPWDVGDFTEEISLYNTGIIDFDYNELVTRILKNNKFRHQRDLILWNYVKNIDNLKKDLIYYDELFNQTKQSLYKDWKQLELHLKIKKRICSNRNIIEQRFLSVRNTLKNSFANVKIDLNNNNEQDFLNIKITVDGHSTINWETIELLGIIDGWDKVRVYQDINNNGKIDLEDKKLSIKYQKQDEIIKIEDINEVLFTNRNWDKERLEIIDVLPYVYNYILYFPNKLSITQEKFDIKLGFKNAITGDKINPMIKYVYRDKFIEINSEISRYDFIKNYSLFSVGIENNEIKIKKGTYFINENIIIPSQFKLKIESGVNLNFAPNVSLISYSAINAQGTNQDPIIFTAQNRNKGWGVLSTVDSGKNIFENCIIEYGGEAYINGIFFSGQLSIHHADVVIENCKFQFANGDDGLNVKNGKVEIKNNVFSNNKFDGLDLDWVTGVVSNNDFFDNGQKTNIDGDGLDLSGSADLIIFNNKFKNSPDKCLSVGEDSKDTTIIFNNLFSGCDIGIAVKDNSKVKIINNVIIDNKIGISVYEKKPVFGGAWPVVINTIIWNNDESINLDEKSNITISYSAIQNGYEGENNFNQEPIFQNIGEDNFLLFDDQQNLTLTNGGYVEVVNNILNKRLEIVPIGLFNLFSEFYD